MIRDVQLRDFHYRYGFHLGQRPQSSKGRRLSWRSVASTGGDHRDDDTAAVAGPELHEPASRDRRGAGGYYPGALRAGLHPRVDRHALPLQVPDSLLFLESQKSAKQRTLFTSPRNIIPLLIQVLFIIAHDSSPCLHQGPIEHPSPRQYYPLNLPFSPILSLHRCRSLPFLTLIANVGLILYMFLVGLELEPVALLRNARQTVAISVTGIIVPFCLGALGR